MENISRLEPPSLSVSFAPIIVSGVTGAGKDTIASGVCRLVSGSVGNIIGLHQFVTSNCRFTDRPRRPDEIDGVHGNFISPIEFDQLQESGQFVYSYQKDAYRGARYGFSLPAIKEETRSSHAFIIGGEIGTAISLFAKLDSASKNSAGTLLPPVLLFVNRPTAEDVIAGLNNRKASEQELAARVSHIQNTWVGRPQELDVFALQNPDRTIFTLNDDLDTAVKQTTQELAKIINDLRTQVLATSVLAKTA